MTGRILTCENCGTVFESAWTEKEARDEAARNYPGLNVDAPSTAVVCDDCYKRTRRKLGHDQ